MSYTSRSWWLAVGQSVGDGLDLRRVRGHPQLDRDAVDARHVEQLVADAQPRLVRVVVDAVHARQERVALRAQVREHGADAHGLDAQRRAFAEEQRVGDYV